MKYQKPRFIAQLSPVFCTPEMKEQVIDYAQMNNLSLSEVQRRALALFLGENYSKSIDNQPKTTDEKEIEPA
jgi:hypothetical protein